MNYEILFIAMCPILNIRFRVPLVKYEGNYCFMNRFTQIEINKRTAGLVAI